MLVIGSAAHNLVSADGGVELNCSIADAGNLAWKLSHIYYTKAYRYTDVANLRGTPVDPKSSRLLDSYAAERYYTAQYYGALADTTLEQQLQGLRPLSVPWTALTHFSRNLLAFGASIPGPARCLWRPVRRLADATVATLFALMFRCLIPLQKVVPLYWMGVQRRFQSMLHQSSEAGLNVEYCGADLHYAYRNSPLNPQVKNGIPYIRAPSHPTSDTAPTIPGCRVPHAYLLTLGSAPSKLGLISTLDLPLLTPQRHRFCLILWQEHMYYTLINALVDELGARGRRNHPYRGSSTQHNAEGQTTEHHRLVQRLFTDHVLCILWTTSAGTLTTRLLLHHQHADIQPPTAAELAATSLATTAGTQTVAATFQRIQVVAPQLSSAQEHAYFSVSPQPAHELLNTTSAQGVGACGLPFSSDVTPATAPCSKAFSPVIVPQPAVHTPGRHPETRDEPVVPCSFVWSDRPTLENFIDALRIGHRFQESSVLLRPDNHVMSVCDGQQGVRAFVKELLLLPVLEEDYDYYPRSEEIKLTKK